MQSLFCWRKALSVVAALSVAMVPSAGWAGGDQGEGGAKDAALQTRKNEVIGFVDEAWEKKRPGMSSGASGMNSPGTSVQSGSLSTASPTYVSQIDMFRIHEFWFEVAETSTVSVQARHVSDEVGYVILKYQPDGGESPEYADGDVLTPGRYAFVVFSSSRELVRYEYQVSGIRYAKDPFTHLPSSIELDGVPAGEHVFRLAKGTTYPRYTGYSWANGWVWIEPEDPQGVISYGVGRFDFYAPAKVGANELLFYYWNEFDNAVYETFYAIVPGVKRISGANRYEVSARIAGDLPDDSSTVVIARGDLYTDALSGGPLASLVEAPILLTSTSSLPSPILDEIRRRQPERAIILGGPGSVSTGVESQLRSLGVTDIQRIAGSDRFAVSANIASRLATELGQAQSDTAIVASGLNFPDALSASSIAGQEYMPILLVGTSSVPASIDEFIRNHPAVKNFVIVGGPATVSDGVKAKLDAHAAGRGGNVVRIGGANRYQVAVNVAKYFGMDPTFLVIAKGTDFPDALSGGPYASFYGAPIVLTPPARLDPAVQAWLSEAETDVITILGGTGSVSPEVERQLDRMIQ